LRRLFHKELCDESCSLKFPDGFLGCPYFKEGQEFIVEGHNQLPEKFWAWADIQKDVLLAMYGGNFPWVTQKGTNITCCTDGLMPVIFKVEKIE